MSTQAMTEGWLRGLLQGTPPPAVYTMFTPSEGSAEQRYEAQAYDAAMALDYWDGRVSREANFVQLIRTRFPRAEVRDLTPILDELRSVKSPREVALVRRASQMAGLGIMEAVRNSRPGVYEYQLDAAARFVFLAHGARLEGYRSITASGTPNIWNGHYYRNMDQLKAGDLVLMDFAPDYAYYTSDVARMWPVSGKFNPTQRELLQFVLEYRNAVLKRIRPGVSAKDIQAEVTVEMEEVLKKTKFSKPIYEQAARKMVETGGGAFSHPVGMAVHDDGGYRTGVLKPGHVFSIDPQLWVPEETLYIRYEDVVVVTDKGVENFTHFLPTELDEIEKLVGQGGILRNLPALPR
jgi:Xaa-Pro aminopeptidase